MDDDNDDDDDECDQCVFLCTREKLKRRTRVLIEEDGQ